MIPTLIAQSHHYSPQKKKEQLEHQDQDDQPSHHHHRYGGTTDFTSRRRRKASTYITLIVVLGIIAITSIQKENKQSYTNFLWLGQQQSKTKKVVDVVGSAVVVVDGDTTSTVDKKEKKNNYYYGISKDLTYQEKLQVLQQQQQEQSSKSTITTSTTATSSSSSSNRVVSSSSIFKTDDDNNVVLMDRLIVIPEYKLVFCFIGKVGCAMFNHVFRLVRLLSPQFQQSINEELQLLLLQQQQQQQQQHPEQQRFGKKKKKKKQKKYQDSLRSSSSSSYIEEVKYQMANLWFRNTPQHHNLTSEDVELIFQNPNWTKAVFYRDPVTRFLSGFRSKCLNYEDITDDTARENILLLKKKQNQRQYDGGNGSHGGDDPSLGFTTNHCYRTFGTNYLQYLDDAIDILRQNPTKVFDNGHFKPQVEVCGGITSQTLQYYDFVQQLVVGTPPPQSNTTRSAATTGTTYSPTTLHMKRLFEKIGMFSDGDGGGSGDTIEKKIQQHLLDTVEKGGIHDLPKDNMLVTTYLNLTNNVRRGAGGDARNNSPQSSPETTASLGRLEFEFEFRGSQRFAASKHSTNTGHSSIRNMFRNSSDTATIQRLLEQLQDMYQADYGIFQMPKLTLDEYDVAGV